MTDLAAWLLACNDERAEDADEIHVRGCPATFPYSMPCDCGEPDRVLAECAAKRAVVEFWSLGYSRSADFPGPDFDQVRRSAHWTLLKLAQPYAARPDFDPSWRLEQHTG